MIKNPRNSSFQNSSELHMPTGVTVWLTLNASTPAWMTGAKTVSLSAVSANMVGIWSRRLMGKQGGLLTT